MKLFKLLLLKAYFDKGLSLTNYFKYILAFVGIFELIEIKQALWIGIIYCVLCFFLGWIWYKKGIIDTENEINNIFNPFQREVRKKLKNRKI